MMTEADKTAGGPVLHVRCIAGEDEARAELQALGVDPQSVPIMAPKVNHHVIKIKDLDVRAANVLKQEMLAKGAEAAVARWASGFTRETTDVLLMGTTKQYRHVLKKLKIQPFGLRDLVPSIERALAGVERREITIRCGGDRVVLGGKTLVMGILNLTPDSFSDGGAWIERDEAVRRAYELVEAGADIIDVGGESTRPGSHPVAEGEERRRVIPVVKQLKTKLDVPISVDTSKAAIAEAAIDAGAGIINDVTALSGDPRMGRVCAKGQVGVVLMHMLGKPRTMQDKPEYADLIADIVGFFNERIALAVGAGIAEDRLLVDPGFGFGKTNGHNLEILKRLGELRSLGRPIVLGTSRKATIGAVLGGLGIAERVEGTAATVAAAVFGGVGVVRVHDVKEMSRVTTMCDAIMAGEAWDG